MGDSDLEREQALFHACLDLPADERRALPRSHAWRRSRSSGARVERLLVAHDRAEAVHRAIRCSPPRSISCPTLPLDTIGPYRLIGVLGEGGMGVVYEAEQRSPVQRRVALKIVKLGMDTATGRVALHGRAAGAGGDGSPVGRQGVRRRPDRGGPPLLRHGAGARRAAPGLLRRPPPVDSRAARALRPDLSRRAARAPEGRDSPRSEAVQSAGGRRRWTRASQGHRLRCGQGGGGQRTRRHGCRGARHGGRPADRDPRLHESRTGRPGIDRHRHQNRRVFPGRGALRAHHRLAAGRPCGTRLHRVPVTALAGAPGARAAECARAVGGDPRSGSCDAAVGPAGGPQAAGGGRSRLDRHESARGRPRSPLPHGSGAGRGSRAVHACRAHRRASTQR